jgi:GNAT superfamily N-acetyltransferase
MLPVFEYRALGSPDFEAAGALLLESYPYRGHEPPSWQRPAPDEQPRRWGAFHQSAGDSQQSSPEILAYAALWRVEGEKFRIDVVVGPRHVRQGLGRCLFDVILQEARVADATTLQARASDNCGEALAFLARREFVETMRMRGFVLDLTTANTRALVAATDLATPPGVSIAAVTPEQGADSRFWRKLLDLQEAAREGWPDPDPGGPLTPVQPTKFRSMLMPSSELPVAFFVASREDQFVGYSALLRQRATSEARFAATAVHPGVRRQGISTALRARCLVVAQAAGCTTVRSASGNDALIRSNARFGFKETYCEVRLVRRLK